MLKIQNHLDVFREKYAGVKVFAETDYLAYKVGAGSSDKAAKAANVLIEELGLPLVAIPTTLIKKDSFIVKSNEVEL